MSAAKIISELCAMGEYLGSAEPDDEPADFAVVRRQRAALIEELKRRHGVDYEGVCAAERLRDEHDHEMLFSELNAALEPFMRRDRP